MNKYKLYVKNFTGKTINELLIYLYSRIRSSYGCTSKVTFYDIECTKIQCSKDWRGFDDLLLIVKTYFPSTTEKILMKRLIALRIPRDYIVYGGGIGKNMYRPNFGYCTESGILRYMPYIHEAFVCEDRKMNKSAYTWEYLFGLLNIYDETDFIQYKKDNNLN